MRISDWSSDVCSSDLVDTSLAARREAKRARFGAMQWGAIAASLALGLTIGLRPWLPTEPVAVQGGALVAAGPLSEALDTQLASNQPANAPVRIGLSFRDRTGRYCRRSEEHTSELQSLMRNSYAVFCSIKI